MKSPNLKIIGFVLVISMLSSSCGVMFGGSKYRAAIVVNEHPDAEIYSNGEKLGEGQANRLFPRNKPLNLELRKEGCEPFIKNYQNTFRTGNFILSFLSWGLIGAAVDLGTGASYKPDHKFYPEVKRENDKTFTFRLDFEGCPTK